MVGRVSGDKTDLVMEFEPGDPYEDRSPPKKSALKPIEGAERFYVGAPPPPVKQPDDFADEDFDWIGYDAFPEKEIKESKVSIVPQGPRELEVQVVDGKDRPVVGARVTLESAMQITATLRS